MASTPVSPASSKPLVGMFYYHRLLDHKSTHGSSDDNQKTNPLPDPPLLFQGHVSLTLPAPARNSNNNNNNNNATNSGPHGTCLNAKYRRDLWLANPIPTVPEAYKHVGLLTQLGLLCSAAKVRECDDKACIERRKALQDAAPPCRWKPFRDWALVAMSCQVGLATASRQSLAEKQQQQQQQKKPPDEKREAFARADRLSRAHTHLVNVVHACYVVLENARAARPSLLWPTHDGFPAPAMDLSTVGNVVYWMVNIQAFEGLGTIVPSQPRWDQYFLPRDVTVPAIRDATRSIPKLYLCNCRFWNLVNLAERKQSDLPDIIDRLNQDPRRTALQHADHDRCAPTKCQYSHKDSTKVGQLHKCEFGDCSQSEYPVAVLPTALELGEGTAWSTRAPKLSAPDEPYIAISHVWADGTGVGISSQGLVNSCLFGYFARIAESLGCQGIWWDALSIPLEPKARGKALSRMHKNYANAQYTVVHDRYLLDIQCTDPETACLAIVLSPWFTRGWTSLELRMATKVKVLFKGSDPGAPDVRDLTDLLAPHPGPVSRVHWLASTMIRRLRTAAVEYIDDILAILRPRDTSWARDRTVIAGLLTGVPRCDYSQSEGEITRTIIQYLGSVPYSSLLHGRATMSNQGPFSWCPATLDEMPIDSSTGVNSNDRDARRARMLRVKDGAVVGKWQCEAVTEHHIRKNRIQPHGDHVSVEVPFYNALLDWENCAILRERKGDLGPALLVVTMRTSMEPGGPVMDCRYIGAVRVAEEDDKEEPEEDGGSKQNGPLSCDVEVRIGSAKEKEWLDCAARDAINKWLELHESWNGKDIKGVPDPSTQRASGDQKHAQGGEDEGEKNLQRPKKGQSKRKGAPWYTKSDVQYYSQPQADELDETDTNEDGSEEEAAETIRQLLRQAFQSPNAAHLIHLFVCQGVDIPDDVKDELSVGELSLLSSVYLANGLGDEAQETCRRAVTKVPQTVPSGDMATLNAMSVLAKVCWKTESFDSAKSIYMLVANSCTPGKDREVRLQRQVLGELCLLHSQLGQMDEAAACYRRALEEFGTAPGPVYAFSYDAVTRLGLSYWERGDRDRQLEGVYKVALGTFERELSNRDAVALITAYNLAAAFFGLGYLSEAEETLNGVISGLKEVAGPRHELSLRAELDLARIHILQGRITKLTRMTELLEECKAGLGQQHWLLRLALLVTGVHHSARQLAEAIPLLQQAQETPPTHDMVDVYLAACARRELGMIQAMQGNLDEAESNYQGAREALTQLASSEHLEMYVTEFCLATVKGARGKLDGKSDPFQGPLDGMERVCGPTDPETREVVSKLGRLCKALTQVEAGGNDVDDEYIQRPMYRLGELLRCHGDLAGSKGRLEAALPANEEEMFSAEDMVDEWEVDKLDPHSLKVDDDEIVVKNAAVSIREIDWQFSRTGEDDQYDFGIDIDTGDSDDDASTKRETAGDVAGTVYRMGRDATRFKKGDRVLGLPIYSATQQRRHRGFQDYTVVPSRLAARIPHTLSFRQAAVLPLGISTAAAALFEKDHLQLPPPSLTRRSSSQTASRKALLVWGATTSAGCNAIQLAVAAGCEVIATDEPKNFDYVRELGAAQVVNSRSPTIAADLQKAFGSWEKVGAFDAEGSEAAAAKCAQVGAKVVSASKVSAAKLSKEVSKWVFEQFLPRALAEGKYQIAPDPLSYSGRGSKIQLELESGKKLIINVDPVMKSGSR